MKKYYAWFLWPLVAPSLGAVAHPVVSKQQSVPAGVYVDHETVIVDRVEYRLPFKSPAAQASENIVITPRRHEISITQKGLVIFVHKRNISINGKSHGKIRRGDHVVVGADGSLQINGLPR